MLLGSVVVPCASLDEWTDDEAPHTSHPRAAHRRDVVVVVYTTTVYAWAGFFVQVGWWEIAPRRGSDMQHQIGDCLGMLQLT